MKITDQAGLTKAAKTMADHLEKHMEMHKAHHEKLEGMLAKDHPLVKSSQAMMDHCEKCMKAAKDAGAGEEPEPEEKITPVAEDAVSKAVAAALAPVLAEVTALKAKMETIPAPGQQIPATGAGGPQLVSKTIDADAAFGELIAK